MNTVTLKPQKYLDLLKKFIYSPYFVGLIGLIIFISWLTPNWMIGLIIISIIASLILAFYKDTLPVTSILWMFVFIIGTNRHQLAGFSQLLFCVIPLVLGLIVNIIRFRPKFSFLHPAKIQCFTLAIIISSLSIMLGGVSRGGRSVLAVLAILGLGIVLAIGYMFFKATIQTTDDKQRMLKYVSVIMYISAIVISLQLIVFYIRLGSLDQVLEATRYKTVDIGWAGNNNYSVMLALCLPAILYYAINSKKLTILHTAFSLLVTLLIIMSMSRGTILVLLLALPFLWGYSIIKAKKKAQVLLTIALLLDIAILALLYYAPKLVDVVGERLKLGLSSNGRLELYSEAIELFKQKPIFGWGFDYRLGEFAHDSYTPYWYHSTVLQAMASMGIVGLLSLIYLEFSRYRTFLTKRNTLKLAVMAGLLLYDLYSLVDVCFYAPNTYIIFMLMSLAAEKDSDENTLRPLLVKKLYDNYLIKKQAKHSAGNETTDEDKKQIVA